MLISRDMNCKVLNAMQSTGRSTKSPTEVECMLGKFVVDAAAGGQFVALVCDDTQFHPPRHMPDNAELDVMVPQDARYSRRRFATTSSASSAPPGPRCCWRMQYDGESTCVLPRGNHDREGESHTKKASGTSSRLGTSMVFARTSTFSVAW
jgi:hypothetical protein